MLRLYHCDFSTCSQKVRLCLAEKELAFESQVVDLAAREHLKPDYLALNPNGVVPTLLFAGQPVVDSSVICEFLEEMFPAPALSPADALGRARMRAWMRYLEEAPTAAIRVPSFNRIFAGAFADLDDEAFFALTEPMPLRKGFYREMGRGGFTAAKVEESLERLRQTLRRAETALAKDPWLAGEAFSLADILLIPTAVRMQDLGLDALWRDLPGFAGWFARAQARASFDQAFYPGSRLDPSFSWAASGRPQAAASHQPQHKQEQ
ncbi:MAG TPA: glutathione S-transferase family protein [Phenylobacterium sp.]|nr:glutathione S-transferase family protein [Phenylobacterium sp.]